ncbi:platelet glycoprotein V-like [Schistocerca nitens]|uniref:platelet glycoprotein V-like n=1 Tax=Schistocerca nitens TaxID=7011 RepID=UPI002117BC79|nr:platelet glycoprotein V-like [Schistocerca nitens]
MIALEKVEDEVSQLLPGTFAANRNLSAVDLSDNQLDGLPAELFRHNALLTQLKLSGNHIEALHVDTFKANRLLQELDLSDNPLLELPAGLLQHCPHLRSLNFSRTRVSALHRTAFSRNAALESLDLSSNSLQALPAALLPNHGRLSRLDLSSNQLRSIPEKLFSAAGGLRLLNLSHNGGCALLAAWNPPEDSRAAGAGCFLEPAAYPAQGVAMVGSSAGRASSRWKPYFQCAPGDTFWESQAQTPKIAIMLAPRASRQKDEQVNCT